MSVENTRSVIIEYARSFGFSGCIFIRPEPLLVWRDRIEKLGKAAPEGARRLQYNPFEIYPQAKTLLALFAPYKLFKDYDEGVFPLSSYYITSNSAYHNAVKLCECLNSIGIGAVHARKLPYRAALHSVLPGGIGVNQLLYYKNSSYHCIQMLLLDAGFTPEKPIRNKMPCKDCGACFAACPTGALSEAGLDYGRCLKSHMHKGGIQGPYDKLVYQLLGCDKCQTACPVNSTDYIKPPKEVMDLFAYEKLLNPSQETKLALTELLGARCDKRVFAHAKILAENLNKVTTD